jgi:hypothetical protein
MLAHCVIADPCLSARCPLTNLGGAKGYKGNSAEGLCCKDPRHKSRDLSANKEYVINKEDTRLHFFIARL